MLLEISISEQLYCCLMSLLFGLCAGVTYSVFNIVSLCIGIKPHRPVKVPWRVMFISLEIILDLVFSVIVTIGFCLLTYIYSYGRFRFVFLLCAGLSFFIYYHTLGKAVDLLSLKMIKLIKASVSYILKLLLKPVVFAWSLTFAFLKAVYRMSVGRIINEIVLSRNAVKAKRFAEKRFSDIIKL